MLYSVEHHFSIYHVHLLSDQSLDFDLITSSWDSSVELWQKGQIVESLEHSNWCRCFDLDKEKRLLAVVTDDGLTLWRLGRYEKIGEARIGQITDVRFNKNATKLIASIASGAVYEISLQ